MLVRRTPNFKGRGFPNLKENKKGVITGSRFSALNDEIDSSEEGKNLAQPVRSNNKNEEVILHQMRLLQKQGVSGLENMYTGVLLPNEETVDFALLNRGANTVINPASIPPDKIPTSKSQLNMEIDVDPANNSLKGMYSDANLSDGVDLEGRTTPIAQ
ncbi:hypothetical protein RIF29_39915 [Crotalaria pallida]|uniref:Uncharacterized protein n=1 Tax=Crotalaria pallida TaxID=3830 RepID=A0AAN9E4K9_CROPI